MKKAFFAVIVGALATAPFLASIAQPAGAVSGDKISVPDNYRLTYQSLGSWAIANDTGAGSKEMHNVFASPGAIAAFQHSRSWQDGTVLIKEVYGSETAPMTTGTVSHAAKLKGRFVMVRDSKNSHAGSKLWGDGWGWSWFDAGKPTLTTSTDYHNDCQGCHVPAKATQWVYSQGYPVLNR